MKQADKYTWSPLAIKDMRCVVLGAGQETTRLVLETTLK